MAFSCAPNCDASVRIANRLAEQKLIAVLGLALLIVIVTAAILIVRHRQKIVSTLDKATVDTLAKGVKAGRKVSGRASAYRQRIVDRADGR